MRLQAAEAKLADISRRVDSMNQVLLAGGSNRTEENVRELRGDVDKLRFDLEGQDKRARDLYQDLDRRLARLEGGGAAAPMTSPNAYAAPATSAPAVVGTVPSAPTPPAAAPPAASEEAAYLASFDLLKAGRYDDAIAGFKKLTQTWPSGSFADNAWYWMGEAYYVKRDYASAIQSFQMVSSRFPSSPKAADAMLKQGLSYSESKQRDMARSMFQRVVKDYPDSNAANLARQRLAQF